MIILGNGVFSVGERDIALTKGGGQFTIEREYREIEADGDRGAVKGRIVLDKSVPKLTINALSLIPGEYKTYYPGLNVNTETNTTITGTNEVNDTDYTTVTWTGKTKEGKSVIITIENAINLENIDWSLVDKEEVVQSLTYTGTYEEGSTKEPWKVEFI